MRERIPIGPAALVLGPDGSVAGREMWFRGGEGSVRLICPAVSRFAEGPGMRPARLAAWSASSVVEGPILHPATTLVEGSTFVVPVGAEAELRAGYRWFGLPAFFAVNDLASGACADPRAAAAAAEWARAAARLIARNRRDRND